VRLERVDAGVIGRESEAGFWVAYEFDGCERGPLGVLKYGAQPVNEAVDGFLPSVLRVSDGEGGDGLFGSGCTRWMRTSVIWTVEGLGTDGFVDI
jgi:hypothetical protein